LRAGRCGRRGETKAAGRAGGARNYSGPGPLAQPSRGGATIDRESLPTKWRPAISPSATRSRLFVDPRLFYAGALVLTSILMAVDFTTWIELDVASVYPIPLVLAAGTRRRTFLWLLTALIVVTTFVVYALQIPPGVFSLHEPYFVNRVFDVVGVVLTAALLHVWIRSVDIREAQLRLLDGKNRELEAANAELLRREAQIAAQNELLDRRRREAEEASGRKTALLAAVSHDIRTPLSSIQLTADVLRRTVTDPHLAVQIPGIAQRLQANAASLLEVASELIEAGAYDTGRIECHVSEFDLRELVAAKCGDVLPLAQAKMLKLEIDAPAEPIFVATDRTKLGRIVSNLLANAVKFTRAGVVRAAILEVDGGLAISVSDTGIGIAPDRLSRIFDGYGATRDTGGRHERGFGLGLSICRRLGAMLGGELQVESTPGAGSTFTFRLPAACVLAAHRGRLGTLPGRPSAHH
jgi:signal transduction histidine kinase